MVGRLCVIDPAVRTLTALQRRSLETLATNVTTADRAAHAAHARPAFSSPESGQTAATVVAQLAAELSHDLRVPLSSIIASVELLEDELDGPLVPRDRRAPAPNRAGCRTDGPDAPTSPWSTAPRARSRLREVDLAQLADQLVMNSATLLEASGGHRRDGRPSRRTR